MTWEFSDFHKHFNEWVESDDPPDDFRFWVTAWLYRLIEDPRSDAVPASDLGEPWWFVQVPHAESDSHAVVCLYSIDADQVRCSGFSTLRKPVG